MIPVIKYTNNQNESILLNGVQGIILGDNTLRDFVWNAVTKNNRITSFSRKVGTKTMQIAINGGSAEQNIKLRNRFYEVTEKDVLMGKPGRLTVNDYCLKCYITESKKSNYKGDNGDMRIDVVVTAENPSWIKETTTPFAQITATENFLDYPYGYNYDYRSDLSGGVVNNQWMVASDFMLIIYGYVINPTVYIGGHRYTLNVEIGTGEYITIDTREKTIIKTTYDGRKVNCFNTRDISSYIFQKIEPGTNTVTYDGSFRFDVTLVEERSEPKWT